MLLLLGGSTTVTEDPPHPLAVGSIKEVTGEVESVGVAQQPPPMDSLVKVISASTHLEAGGAQAEAL